MTDAKFVEQVKQPDERTAPQGLDDLSRKSEVTSKHEISTTIKPCSSKSIGAVEELKQNGSNSPSVSEHRNEVHDSTTSFSQPEAAFDHTRVA